MVKMKIKKWYTVAYPSDDMAGELYDHIDFLELYHALINKNDIYDFLGASDSLIRERVFAKLSELLKVEYDYVYNLWLK